MSNTFHVQGRVIDARSGRGVPGLRVEAWDHDLLIDDYLGRADRTDNDGRFTIDFDETAFGGLIGERTPDLFFRIFHGDKLLQESAPLLRAFGRAAAKGTVSLGEPILVDVSMPVRAPAGSLPLRQRVHGQVCDAAGHPVPGALVRATLADTNGSEQALADATTSADGRYELRFDTPAGGPVADLRVRAATPDLREVSVAVRRAPSQADETVDLAFTAAPMREPRPGQVVSGCRIDLPPGDVVERVRYEQVLATRNSMNDLRSAWPGDWPELAPSTWERIKDAPLALYVPFEQSWELLGYTRGRLVKSFTLAPGEEQTVEVFTWDRVKTELESTTSSESEQTSEANSTRRDALDVTRDVAKQTSFQLSTGGKVGFNVAKMVDVDMTTNVDAGEKVNDTCNTASHTISEATAHSVGKVRTSRSVKVTESREYGSEERVTRKLRNANTFHTLNLPFFEVLAHYRVVTRLRDDAVRLVALVDHPGVPERDFTRTTVRLNETALRLALMDRELEPGFAAARMLESVDRSCDVLCRSCPCPDDPVRGSRAWRKLVSDAKELASLRSTLAGWPPFDDAHFGAAGARVARDHVDDIVRANVPDLPFLRATVADAIRKDMTSMAGSVFASEAEAKAYLKSYLLRSAMALRSPGLRVTLDVAVPDPQVAINEAQAELLGEAVKVLPPASIDALNADPVIADSAFDKLKHWFLDHAPDIKHASLAGALTAMGVCDFFAGWVKKQVDEFSNYDVLGLVGWLKAYARHYDVWQADVAADETAQKQALLELREDRKERSARLLSAFGLRETAEASERLDALLLHLNEPANVDHYRFAIASQRKTLFSGDADELQLVTHGVLEGAAIASVGDRFAVPVRLPAGSTFLASLEQIRSALAGDGVPPDMREHILPTAALYCEAIPGLCNASEGEAMERFRVETARRQLDNDLQGLEVERLRARLDAQPPLLERDWPLPARVDVAVGNGASAGSVANPAATEAPAA